VRKICNSLGISEEPVAEATVARRLL
jgi:hypothetical protein